MRPQSVHASIVGQSRWLPRPPVGARWSSLCSHIRMRTLSAQRLAVDSFATSAAVTFPDTTSYSNTAFSFALFRSNAFSVFFGIFLKAVPVASTRP